LGEKTIIAWTDRTANFWMGCQKVSDGCKHCYAETLVRDRMGLNAWGPSGTRIAAKGIYAKMRSWNKQTEGGARGKGWPLLVFVGSLMDWAEDHPALAPLRAKMWDTIRDSPNLDFQLLTKRADRIEQCLPKDWGSGYPNVWLGVSVEDMRVASRLDSLRRIPATVRFVSYEPALGPLDGADLLGIDWVIYGGESGPGYRAHDLDWARRMRAECDRLKIAFFYKQSAAPRTEMGIELDGKIVRAWPTPRTISRPVLF